MHMKLLCLAASVVFAVDLIDEPPPLDYSKFLEQCVTEMKEKQRAIDGKWGLDDAERWSLDQLNSTITFTNPKSAHRKVIAKVQIIGSFNHFDKSWTWAWANPTFVDPNRSNAIRLKEYGEKHKLEDLTTKSQPSNLADAWKRTALAAKLFNADSVYRGKSGTADIFMLIRDVRVPPEKAK